MSKKSVATPEAVDTKEDVKALKKLGGVKGITQFMTLETLRPALRELERAAIWAYTLTGDYTAPDKVTVTLQTRGKKARCLAWFSANQWSTREGEDVHEISIAAEHLDRDPVDIVATVVHEVVHLVCHQTGIQDTSKGGRHNKKFKEEAEVFGLECADPVDAYGYGYTSPSADLKQRILKEFVPDVAAFRLFRIVKPKETKSVKTKAYICECEGDDKVTVRVAQGKDFSAHCNKCDADYVEKEAE